MNVTAVVTTVQSLCDDPDGTYIDFDYVLPLLNLNYGLVFNKLNTGFDFDSAVVELPNIAANTPDLRAFTTTGQPLEFMTYPSTLEFKLSGQDATFYRTIGGPLEKPRDVLAGNPYLDSWSFRGGIIFLSKFSSQIDLRIQGEFLFPPLTTGADEIRISKDIGGCLALKTAASVGKARGNPGWVTTYSKDYEDAFDDVNIKMAKFEQRKTQRVGSLSRSSVRTWFRPVGT